MTRILILLLALFSVAASAQDCVGLAPSYNDAPTYIPPTKAIAVKWDALPMTATLRTVVVTGTLRRIDGLTTPLVVEYCATGPLAPVYGILGWADGEDAPKTVEFLLLAEGDAKVIAPGQSLSLVIVP